MFQFKPMKNLNASGEAGLVTTNNKNLYENENSKICWNKNKTTCIYSSINLKPDTIQTIFLNQSLKDLKK